MSSIVVSGDTSGAVTLAVPAVAGTNTVTIAAQTGTLNAAGPAFSAYFTTNQSVTNATFTKIAFNLERFDTASCYDTTNYRFTPNVAGYYQVNLTARPNATTSSSVQLSSIYLNGVEWLRCDNRITAATGVSCNLSTLMYLNGTTDYIEAYAYINGVGTTVIQGGTDGPYSNFSASLVRGA